MRGSALLRGPRLALALSILHLFPVAVAASALSLIETSHAKDTFGTAARSLLWVMAILASVELGAALVRGRWDEVWARSPCRSFLVQITPVGWSAYLWAHLFLLLTLGSAPRFGAITSVSGPMAVFAFASFFGLLAWITVAGAWLARRNSRPGAQRGAQFGAPLEAHFEPACVTAGDSAQLVIEGRDLAAPPGLLLTLEDPLPPRLGRSPKAVLAAAGGQFRILFRAPLERSRRGLHGVRRGLFLRDLFGLFRSSVPGLEGAPPLTVLPRLRQSRVDGQWRPRKARGGALSRLDRQADQDFFHFRDYRPGDDTRRIHWPLSLKHGQLVLRRPESREARRSVLLAVRINAQRGRELESWGAEVYRLAVVGSGLRLELQRPEVGP